MNHLNGLIEEVDELPFQLRSLLGEGTNGQVWSLAPLGVDWSDDESDYDSTDELDSMDSVDSYDDTEDDDEQEEDDYFNESDGAAEANKDDDKGEVERKGNDDESEDEEKEDGEENEWDRDPTHIYNETVMGPVQLVAKMFGDFKDMTVWVVYDTEIPTTDELDNANVVKVLENRREAKHWIRKRQLDSKRYLIEEREIHRTDGAFETIEFVNESSISLFATRLVNDQQSPHILQAFNVYSCQGDGYLLMERANCTLDDLLNDEEYEDECNVYLEDQDVAVLYFQIIFAMLTLQRTLQMKHHDLYPSNVFVVAIDDSIVFRNQPLSVASHLHYHVDGQDYYLPNCGILIKIGDFGSSSITHEGIRYQRIDQDCFNDDKAEWGIWNNVLDGERGYDLQMLMGDSPFIESDCRFKKKSSLRRFLKNLRKVCFGKNGKVSRENKRPLPNHVSNIAPDQVIQNMFGTNPEEWFDFRTHPGDQATIITLGATNWFST